MRIIHEPRYDFDDVLIVPKRSTMNSRSAVELTRRFNFKWSDHQIECFPIIAANLDTVGTFTMAKSLHQENMLTALHKHYSHEQYCDFFENSGIPNTTYFYTLGIRDEDYHNFNRIIDECSEKDVPKLICIDVASAYIEKYVEFLKKFREENPNVVIMAGNVVTAEMTEALILAGADIVKVGIGSGALCLTRRVAGVGVPQLSAVIECADAAHGLGGHICSDGGIVHPGDLGKAFGAGADFVMIGSVLAGHDESERQPIDDPLTGERYMKVYGMSSYEAQLIHTGEVQKYRASEGRSEYIPYKESLQSTLQEYVGGLRSSMTYIGATKIKEIPKRTTFITVHKQLNTSIGS